MRPGLLEDMAERVVIADGAMGTMLQGYDLSLDDFAGHEGCNEILNVTRPDVVRAVHDAYLAVGCDAVETNTFGANLANLAEYGLQERITELAEAGARLAREVADGWSTSDRPRYVLGSIGPGTKLPTLGQAGFLELRDAYASEVDGLLAGGVDALLVETAQDLLQAKAALLGARRSMARGGRSVPMFAQVTVETTGTLLLGSEIGAALSALEPLGIAAIGLNCATGPAEMAEHLRHLAAHAQVALSVMPNAGLPELTPSGARYPLTPAGLADALAEFARAYGVNLVGGCCGTTPEHLAAVVERLRDTPVIRRSPVAEPGVASLYSAVPFRQEASVLLVGERTNANGSRAFREAMCAGDLEGVLEVARSATREGAHLLDVCVDYVGRDGVADMRAVLGVLATGSTLPIMLDSTEPPVIEAGLQMLGGRPVVNSVNFEDGDEAGSRFDRAMSLVAEYGAAVVALCIDEQGQARTAEHKVAVAERLLDTITQRYGVAAPDILVDTLTFTLATGQEESRRDGLETLEAIAELKRRHPQVQTILGLSNISFGLRPAARVVLNSVFLAEAARAGLDAAIVHAGGILPIARIPEERRQVALDLIYDRRHDGYDPLNRLMELVTSGSGTSSAAQRAAAIAALPLSERLPRRIVDADRSGLTADLDEALETRSALEIVNELLLPGMKTVGELFASGEMQLPFVLASAEVMKAAVAYLEPHMERSDARGKGTMVLATVRGDVHDIGKNLVDIILTNNGYTVINLGIKQPAGAILAAAEEHAADAIGMSGLLVKSTVVMRENLEEMNARGIAERYPVLLGGAALTRGYVEGELARVFAGQVRYARDAFEGLHLLDELMALRSAGSPLTAWAPPRKDRTPARPRPVSDQPEPVERSDVAVDAQIPVPPFFGDRVVRGIPLAAYAALLDERATFRGQWGLRSSSGDGPDYDTLVETEGRPRLRSWLERLAAERLVEAAVVYGYYPCVAEGDTLVILDPQSRDERARLSFPRQRRGRRLCLADFFRPAGSGETDVVAFQIVTMGRRISEATAELFAADAYRDYLELHGLGVQLTEALTEYWHARIRAELGIAGQDSPELAGILRQGYRGSRYSFGYPACPDLEQQAVLVDLLRPERIGVQLSEEFQLDPEQSTSAIIVHHPEAKYFAAR